MCRRVGSIFGNESMAHLDLPAGACHVRWLHWRLQEDDSARARASGGTKSADRSAIETANHEAMAGGRGVGRRTGAYRATNADRHDVPHEHGGECGDAVCFPGALPSLVLDEKLPLTPVGGLHRPRGDNPGDSQFAGPQHEFRGGIIGPGAVCSRSESRLVYAPPCYDGNGGPHRARLTVWHVPPRTLNAAVPPQFPLASFRQPPPERAGSRSIALSRPCQRWHNSFLSLHVIVRPNFFAASDCHSDSVLVWAGAGKTVELRHFLQEPSRTSVQSQDFAIGQRST